MPASMLGFLVLVSFPICDTETGLPHASSICPGTPLGNCFRRIIMDDAPLAVLNVSDMHSSAKIILKETYHGSRKVR